MQNKLQKRPKLGIWMLTALVTGNMMGSGVFLLPAALASYGSIGILSWIFTAFGALSLAVVFGKLSTFIRKTGGPYAYCREGFGDFVGFLVAYNYWIALCIGNAAIVVAFTGYLATFFPILKTGHPAISCSISILTVWLLTLVNIFGIRRAGLLQLVTTLLKLIPLILIAIIGLFYVKAGYLKSFNVSGQSTFSAFTGAATLTLWSFIGLESATVPSEDAENPGHTILWATVLGTLIASVVYILSTTAIMGIMPIHQLANSTAPYADAAKIIFGGWGEKMIALGAVISCFGTLNGWTLLQGQIPFAAARDGLFPVAFGKESRFLTPAFALCMSSILISILLLCTLNASLVKQFTFIILLATLSSLIPYFLTVMSELMLFITRYKDSAPVGFKHPKLSLLVSVLAGIYAFWMIVGAGHEVVFYGTLLFLSALPVYVWMRWHGVCRDLTKA